MSLLTRRPSVLGRSQRVQRDDRMFVVATEDRYAPAQYFKAIQESRVVITVLDTGAGLLDSCRRGSAGGGDNLGDFGPQGIEFCFCQLKHVALVGHGWSRS